jgi:hypothetical protein
VKQHGADAELVQSKVVGNPSTLLMDKCLLRGEEPPTDYCLHGITCAHGWDENGRDLHVSPRNYLTKNLTWK